MAIYQSRQVAATVSFCEFLSMALGTAQRQRYHIDLQALHAECETNYLRLLKNGAGIRVQKLVKQ